MKVKLFSMIMLLATFGWGQSKTTRVSADFKMKIESYMSENEARDMAIEQAQIQAMADAFGTKISQTTRTRIETAISQTDTKFSALANSFVNGIWLEDTKEPEIEILNLGGERWIQVSVAGKAKHFEKAGIDFIAKPLKCLDLGCETQDFIADEQIFFYFKSPVDGYLSIYYDDYQNCQMLLPYSNMSANSLEIKADEDYYLFSPEYDYTGNITDVDEYPLWTDKDTELGLLYVIFSTEQYYKPTLKKDNYEYIKRTDGELTEFPKSTDTKSFRKWLNKNLTASDNLHLEVIDLTISK